MILQDIFCTFKNMHIWMSNSLNCHLCKYLLLVIFHIIKSAIANICIFAFIFEFIRKSYKWKFNAKDCVMFKILIAINKFPLEKAVVIRGDWGQTISFPKMRLGTKTMSRVWSGWGNNASLFTMLEEQEMQRMNHTISGLCV